MRLAPASLGGRLIAAAAALIVVAVMVAGGAIGLLLHRFVQGQIDQRLDAQINTVASALEARADGSIGLVRPVDGPPFGDLFSGWYWQVSGAAPPPLRSRSLAGRDLVPPPTRGDWPWSWFRRPEGANGTGPGGERLRFRIQPRSVGPHAVTVVAAAPLAAIDRPLRDALIPVAGTLGLLSVGLVLAMLLQVRLGLRPLATLRAALADVRAGRLRQVPPAQPSEVRPLVDELNSLIAQNDEGLARARRHVANLAHGLKTPLARLGLALEDSGRDATGELQALVAQMDRRIRHHLARARAAAVGGPARARTELAGRAADLGAMLTKLHAGKSIAFAVDLSSDLAVACEPQDVDEMLGNLLDNAFKWARGRVHVTAHVQARQIVIAVEDDGAGLPAEAIPDVLRPGHRLDESAPGYGFGLPITRELAELYGGELRLAASPLGGLRAILVLPQAS